MTWSARAAEYESRNCQPEHFALSQIDHKPKPAELTALTLSVAVEFHHLSAQWQVYRHLGCVLESSRFCIRQQLTVFGDHFICVGGNYCIRLDQFVDHKSSFSRSGRKDVANVQHSRRRVELSSDDELLIRDYTSIARQIDGETVGEAQYITARRPDVSGQAVSLHLLGDVAAEENRTDTVAVRGRYAPDGDTAKLARGSEAKCDHLFFGAAGRRNSRAEPAIHLAAYK